uniref:Uncharacterized protein n=1 Tax=Romanomermis culicivorax TaxID=13658 RepID=A0A915JF66_ROMCU
MGFSTKENLTNVITLHNKVISGTEFNKYSTCYRIIDMINGVLQEFEIDPQSDVRLAISACDLRTSYEYV